MYMTRKHGSWGCMTTKGGAPKTGINKRQDAKYSSDITIRSPLYSGRIPVAPAGQRKGQSPAPWVPGLLRWAAETAACEVPDAAPPPTSSGGPSQVSQAPPDEGSCVCRTGIQIRDFGVSSPYGPYGNIILRYIERLMLKSPHGPDSYPRFRHVG